MKKYAGNHLTHAGPAVLLIALAALAMSGCGSGGSSAATAASSTPSPISVSASTQIHGQVMSGVSVISGSNVQLYAVGTQGMGSSATPLLPAAVTTDSSGDFTIAENYTCPSPASELYLVATGGNPGLGAGTNNQALSLMTLLGACSGLSATAVYPVNEVTTVGSIWPLASYMVSATQLGSSSSDTTFAHAITLINQLVSLEKAVSPGTGIPAGYAVQSAKLDTLADALHVCVSSTGGIAGDGSACGQLFSLATVTGSAAPKSTIDAGLRLAQNDQLSVGGIFQTLPADAPFQPALPVAPTDWGLGLVAIPAVPTIKPAAGAYAVGQPITLTSGTAAAAIHYTLDGSTPGLTAPVYSGPLTLSASETVNAMAVTEDIGSAVASAAFSVTGPLSVSLTPPTMSLSSSQSQQFTAAVVGSTNTAVTWSLNPASGTISATGLYTAPSLIASAQTVTVSATSVADPTKAASATITLNLLPVVGLSVVPASVSLAPSQTQQFSATVTGTSNPAVSWTVNPAVGAISSTGLYTAPASIVGLQSVTVTANSTADSTKAASAVVSITPQGPSYATYYVDNVSGNDINTGTTPAAPFASVAKVNSLNLLPGQTVAFKAGDVWHEMLTITQSGASGAPINYTSYGSGAQPVIDASDTVSGWSLGGASGTLPSYIWTHLQPTNPLLINFAGVTGTPVAGSAEIAAPDQFFWDGSTLYVYSGPDPTAIVEIAARPSALTSPGANYIALSNLELRGGTDVVFCGVAAPCTNWSFANNTFDSGYGLGLHWQLNQGVSGGGLTVNNNTFRGTGGSGIGLANGGSAMGDMISNNTMTDLCKIYIAGSSENVFCDAINLFSQTGIDGGGQILGNSISGSGLTSGAAYGGGIHADTVVGWDIERNSVSNTNYAGIELEKGSGSVARYNLLVNAGQYNYFAGLFIRAGDGSSVSTMLAEYNTVVGGYWACALGISQNSGSVTASNITMAENICTGASSGIQFWLDPGFTNSGNTFTNNGFGVATSTFVDAGDTLYGSYGLLPSPIIGSIAGDPQFVSPSTDNYQLQPTSPDLAIGAFPQL